MPRIRTLKPEFWQDEKLSLLDPLTRLVFLGLISIADDAGRVLDNVKFIDGQLFPSTEDTAIDALDTLARLSRILRYRVASGQSVIQIAGWANHQKVDHPSKYVLPGPEQAVLVQPKVKQAVTGEDQPSSRKARETLATPSRSDLGPTTSTSTSTIPAGAGGDAGSVKQASWLEPSRAVWEAKFGAGSFKFPMAGRHLKPLRDAGVSSEQIAEHLARYLDQTETQYVSLAKFATTFSAWDAPQPIVDPATRLLNERGARALGLA